MDRRQHKEGDLIKVPSLKADSGSSHTFDKVLLISGNDEPIIGNPYVEGASVEAEITEHGKGDKTLVFKFKKRVKYRKLTGHRQKYTELKIGKIHFPS